MKLLTRTLLLLILACFSVHATNTRFAVIGDYGFAGPADSAVAAMIDSWNVDFIVTVGDNSYNPGSIDNNIGRYYAKYIGAYTGSYGSGAPINRFFPSLGNHEYSDGGGLTAYLNYFTLPGAGIATSNSSGNNRYYDFTIGQVQFLALNSNPEEPDGVAWNSTQGSWAHGMLTNYGKNTKWKIVMMHHPPYSSANVHGSTAIMHWPFEQWGVDAVLSGHDHTYERVMVDGDQAGDSIPYFVDGVGGRSLYGFSTAVPGSAVRYSASYGAMLIEADDSTMLIRFYSILGGGSGTLIDSLTVHARATCCRGKIGNVNQWGIIDLSDLSAIVNYVTGSGSAFSCPEGGDFDGSGIVDVADLTIMISYLVGGLQFPPCP